MDELAWPFERFWSWLTHTGGLPAQIIFGGIVACAILGVVVWVSNRR